MTAIRTVLFAAAAAMLASGGPAHAQSTPAEQTYFDLQSAIIAYERCNRMRFDQAQYLALDDQAVALAGEVLGAGTKLTLIERAKAQTAQRVVTGGCGNARVQAALNLFSEQLASSIGM